MNLATADIFAEYSLVRPNPIEPDTVHLVRALATNCGVPDLDHLSATKELMQEIGDAAHYVFVLCDGLGMNLIHRLPASSFMKRHFRRQIRAVCPSTTACALTSIATAHWPAQHGVTGWFTYLAERNLSMTTLPFVERFQGRPLEQFNLSVADVFPLTAYHPRMSYQALTLLPGAIAHTSYANYSRGGTSVFGYQSIEQAIDQIIARAEAEKRPTYTHLYIPDIDSACHHHGTTNPGVMELVNRIDGELGRLAAGLNGRARIIVSADHGLIDVPVSNHMSLFFDDPLMKLLLVPPSGDARLPVFHVQPGKADQFVAAFDERFGRNMKLMSTQETETLHLLGAGDMTPLARGRFGDFIGIACINATLHYVPQTRGTAPAPTPKSVYVAQHAGLSREEMEIPLIIA